MSSEIQKHLGDEAADKIAAEARRQRQALLGPDPREVFAARLRHDLTKETHVVVGDHPPERLRPSTMPRWACPGERVDMSNIPGCWK